MDTQEVKITSMDIQKRFDFIEAYRTYIQLSRRSKAGIEFSFISGGKGNPRLDTGTLPEADHDRKKGFRYETKRTDG